MTRKALLRIGVFLLFTLIFFGSCKLVMITYMINRLDRYSGKVLSDAHFQTEEGTEGSLSSYKGNVLYLTFWDTDCGVAINGFPTANILVEKFEQKYDDVKFINICISEKQAAWKEILASKNPEGINYIIDNKSATQMKDLLHLDRNGFPYFIIVGKDGKIIGNDLSPYERGFIEYALYQARKGIGTKKSTESYLKLFKKGQVAWMRAERNKEKIPDAELDEFTLFMNDFVIGNRVINAINRSRLVK